MPGAGSDALNAGANAGEGLFATLMGRRLRRGAFRLATPMRGILLG
ncbi:hypothetical protein LPC08_20475 [Roseomonas sp. OT10]|nr:hypothetical protein [Roseomonas sp. OT10]UFN48364.1 hypothetical protein LPC08_20475 [Roseomonas sp. OT10]